MEKKKIENKKPVEEVKTSNSEVKPLDELRQEKEKLLQEVNEKNSAERKQLEEQIAELKTKLDDREKLLDKIEEKLNTNVVETPKKDIGKLDWLVKNIR